MQNLENVDITDRSESLNEIQQLIDCIFGEKKHITFDEFKDSTENLCSDLFIIVTAAPITGLGLLLTQTEASFL